jgi:hypothetical protein
VELAEMTLEINLYELTTPFEHYFGNNECKVREIVSDLDIENVLNRLKKCFVVNFCYILGGKFSYVGTY